MLHTIILGVLLCTASSYGLYDASSGVIELTPSNFDKLVTNSDDVWVVEFFAPWCGHCKNLVPEYKKVAKALKGIIKVGAVDADAHKSLAQKYSVQGFPTIKIFSGSKHTPYSGQRNAESFIDAALKAAKDRAYENLGKKPSSSSDKYGRGYYGHSIQWKKITKTTAHSKIAGIYTKKYGHSIPWKQIQKITGQTKSTAHVKYGHSIPWKQIKKTATNANTKILQSQYFQKLKELQLQLFRGRNFYGTPKIVKTRKLADKAERRSCHA